MNVIYITTNTYHQMVLKKQIPLYRYNQPGRQGIVRTLDQNMFQLDILLELLKETDS